MTLCMPKVNVLLVTQSVGVGLVLWTILVVESVLVAPSVGLGENMLCLVLGPLVGGVSLNILTHIGGDVGQSQLLCWSVMLLNHLGFAK